MDTTGRHKLLKRVAAAQSPSRHSIAAMESALRKRPPVIGAYFARLTKIAIVILLVLPVLILGAIQLKQYFRVRFSRAITVALHVEDTNGHPITEVDFRFRENGVRYLVPGRFFCSWSWHTKGTVHEVTTDASGIALVSVRDQMLSLEGISVGEKPATNFMTVFHRSDGLRYTHTRFFEYFGHNPNAKDPWTLNYTVIIQ
jgi:hypothetical protein